VHVFIRLLFVNMYDVAGFSPTTNIWDFLIFYLKVYLKLNFCKNGFVNFLFVK